MKLKKRSTFYSEAKAFCLWRRRNGGAVEKLHRRSALERGQRQREVNALEPLDVAFARNEREGRLA